ncbi:raffinose/stachyose/melibiose transport system substrate-binding protein [Evansella caseinilytica]|uniref:Raffinose/stachyose/melibiose transport system substrate-binding protein n=1 Tax=Evansella caseinilytica TaxID=1503961 RepID=A0A1H3G0Y7_9BACI|nr:ABC transporter substrate-binding protein [Evansella caseinilytica]SDX96064.1 raffinose/stachyose/melibiose transport system substrate-binding protein [Evansella caseinilytica]
MLIKKLAIGFIAVITMAVVAACSDAANDGSSDNQQGRGEVTIELFNIKVETANQLHSLIEEYESENEHVKINVTTVGGGQDASSALQAKFSSRDEPAIFLLGGLSDVEKYSKYLLDVSDMASAKAAIDGTLQGATLAGTPYGIPLNIEGFGWMMNKDIFERAGVDPDSIDSYDTFVEAVETIDSQKEQLGIDAVFAFSAMEDWVVSQFSNHFTAPEFDNDVNVAYEAAELTFEYGDRMKAYTDLMNQYNYQPILSLDYSTSVEELFANDRAAMIHQGNWIVPSLNSIDETFTQEKLGILPLFTDSDDEGYISAGPSWFWGINKEKDDEVVEESKKFIDWMYTSEKGKERIVTDFQYVPAHEGYDADAITDPVSKEVYEMLLDGKGRIWAHNQYPDGFFSTALFPEFQKYLGERITWEEFEEAASEKFKEMR